MPSFLWNETSEKWNEHNCIRNLLKSMQSVLQSVDEEENMILVKL